MDLRVPLIYQEPGSVDCGLACVLMVLRYYGINANFSDIRADISTDTIGSYAPQLGSLFLKKGFQAELVTLHPGLFTINDIGRITQKKVLQRMISLRRDALKKKGRDKKSLGYFIEYLKIGGTIDVCIPDVRNVKSEIEQKRPVIALLTSVFLSSRVPKFNFHFNVITGIDDKYVYVNDPLRGALGGKKRYRIKDYFFGIHASTYGDLNNGSLLKIRH